MFKKVGLWFSQYASTFGPWGIFLVALGDSAFIPLPQGVDALIIAQTIAAPDTAYLAAGLGVVGSLLGSFILYSIARRVGHAMLAKKASSKGIETMRHQVERYDALVLLLPTMLPLPLPMKIFVIAAGVFEMNAYRFLGVIAFARVVRYFGIAYAARLYGDETTTLMADNLPLGITIAVVIIILFVVVNRWSTRRLSEG